MAGKRPPTGERPLARRDRRARLGHLLGTSRCRRSGKVSITVAEVPGEPLPLRALLADVQRCAIESALLACGGNRTRTAERLLGISRRQLFDKIREYDLGT